MDAGWSLSIKEMSWVEHTREEVDFVVEALALEGGERVLDLACGYGRHSLELARRGYDVVGVDITPAYIADARAAAAGEGLDVTFLQGDVREVPFVDAFDVVLNMADGAIGYFPTEEGNLALFDAIGRSLRVGESTSWMYAAPPTPPSTFQSATGRRAVALSRWPILPGTPPRHA